MDQNNMFKPYSGEPDIERLKSAFKKKPVDRVPNWEGLIEDKHVEKILGRPAGNTSSYNADPSKGSHDASDEEILPMKPEDYIQICETIGQDGMLLVAALWVPFKVKESDGRITKIPPRSVKTREDFNKITIDSDGQISILLKHIRDYKKAIKDKDSKIGIGVVYGTIMQTLYESVMGMHDFMMACYEDKNLVEDMLETSTIHCERLTKAVLKEGIDYIYIGDDLGFKTGLFLPPKLIKEIWVPRMTRIIEPAVHADVPIMFHSDGKIDDIVNDLIEMGVDCLNPLDPYAIDYKEYKKKYGDSLSFCGNIDIEFPLSKGKPEDVEKDVKEHMDVLKPGDGFICSSSHSIVNYIPFENFVAQINAIHKYGAY
jgi:uroporphyrinogen-III decarboxylase